MKRKRNNLRNKTYLVVDFETEALAVGRALFIQKPTLPHSIPFYTKLTHPLRTKRLPSSYKFNTQYDAIAYNMDMLRRLACQVNCVIVTAIQRERPKTVNLFATWDLRNIRF